MMNLLKAAGRASSQKRCFFYSFPAFSFSEMKDYYKILGVSPTASQSEIKSSFYRLAKMYHPDVNKNTAEKFKEINEAYETLSDEFKKRVYDQQLNRRDQQQAYSRYQSSNPYGDPRTYQNQEHYQQNRRRGPDSDYYDDIFNARMRDYEERMKRAKYYEDFYRYNQQRHYEV